MGFDYWIRHFVPDIATEINGELLEISARVHQCHRDSRASDIVPLGLHAFRELDVQHWILSVIVSLVRPTIRPSQGPAPHLLTMRDRRSPQRPLHVRPYSTGLVGCRATF